MTLKPKILIVDDEEENLWFIKSVLEQQNYELLTAQTGQEAIALLANTPDIEVMLLDLIMPDMGGFEVLERVKAQPQIDQVKVLMVSARNATTDKVKALTAGAADYIVRPFDQAELIARIETQLKLYRAEKQLRESEAKNRALLNAIPDLILRLSREGIYLEIRSGNEDILPMPAAQMIGKRIFDILPKATAEQSLDHIQRALETGQVQVYELELILNGCLYYFEARIAANGPHEVLVIAYDITRRKQAETALRQSQARYERLFEDSPISLWEGDFSAVKSYLDRLRTSGVTDFRAYFESHPEAVRLGISQIKLIDINKATLEIFQAKSKEELLRNLALLFNEETFSAFQEELIALLEGHKSFETETTLQTLTGHRFYANTKVTLAPGDEATWSRVFFSLTDISRHKKAEEAVRSQVQFLETLLDTIPSPVFYKDSSGIFQGCNKIFADQLLGLPPEQIIGRSAYEISQVISTELAALIHQQDLEAIQTPGVKQYEVKVPCADGQLRHFVISKTAFRDSANNPAGVIGVLSDITELNQALARLRLLSQVVEQGASSVMITGKNPTAKLGYSIEYINPAFTRLSGYSYEEAVGRDPDLLHSGEQSPEIYQDVAATVMKGESWEGELLSKHKDGNLYWEHITISPIKDESGVLTHYVGIGEDITHSKQLEQELRRAKEAAEAATKAKSEFLANMSHEIRTPMNGVIGMTSLLLDTDLSPQQREFVEIIRASGDALLTVINNILDFSKIEAGKLELEYQPFDLRSSVEEALALVAPRAAEKGLELAYLVEHHLPAAFEGDVTRLRQILVNFLSNAVKFTEAGEVVVSVTGREIEPEQYELCFAVNDTGIGIPEDGLERLFHSFSQVDASTTRRYGGTGLGLVISKRLAKLMGGNIRVESEVGQGSTFSFSVQARAVAGEKLSYLDAAQPDLTHKRILIVDDNATNRRILSYQTEAWGMRPVTVESGAKALALLQQGVPFDLAILDMQMPDMDGQMLAAEIRHYRDSKSLPLIMLSSLGYIENSDENNNCSHFAASLSKPIKPFQLYDILTNVIAQQPQATRPVSPPAEFNHHMGKTHPLHILLAEDNVVNQKVALVILQRLGYQADVAANGLEVIQALQRQPYDVVLMDVQMPEMDGMTATRLIRQQFAPERQPWIIAMTANALPEDRETYLAAGMDDYVSKPIPLEAFIRALRQCQPHHEIT